jgi:MSHA biogenesis protein MshQ
MTAPTQPTSGNSRRALRALLAACIVAFQVPALAAPGDTIYSENFNGNGSFNDWTEVASGGDASRGTGAAVSNSGNSALRLRWGPVYIYNDSFDATVPAARLDVWIRRGGNFSGSESPENGEDLHIEYRTAGGSWVTLASFPGSGSSGEVLTPSLELPAAALHANASVRFRLQTGSGNDFDYWHVDDLVITEIAPPVPPFGIGSCEDFESGLGGWTISASGGGNAGTSAATYSSPTSSLYTRGGPVEVTSHPIDLSGGGSLLLSLWIQRGGSFGGSERPDNNEDFVVEYLSSDSGWVTLETFDGNGSGGQVYTPSYTLSPNALHSGFRLRLRQENGSGTNFDYWHADDICVTAVQPISYRFEEDAWNGSGGEIVEQSGSGLDGTAIGGATNANLLPALTGNPGTCRYGSFDGIDDYIEIAENPALDAQNELTVSAWIYMRSYPPELHTIVSKDTNYEFHIDNNGYVYWWWERDSIRTTGYSISLNQWYHIAVTYESGSQIVYVNGIPRANNNDTGTLPQNDVPLHIGTDWDFIARAFDGFIDEVTIYQRALSPAEVQSLMAERHDCPDAAAQFSINHDNYGIHCLPELITVDVVDANAGTPLTNYNADVRLDTGSGNGTWTLASGGGSLVDATADDGIAVYAWPLGESQAVFALAYTQGMPIVDVDVEQVSDTGIRDTDAEGLLEFSPSGFTLTAAPYTPPAAVMPFAAAQTAGMPFDVHITAYGTTEDDPVCGVIESYNAPSDLQFWYGYANPSSGTRSPTVATLPASPTEAGAGVQSVSFNQGRAAVSVNYKDVGSLQLFVKDESTGNTDLPAGIRGGTADFVVRPFDLVVSNVVNAGGAGNDPTVDSPDDAVFARAGEPFALTVTSVDADGDATPNFGRENIPEEVSFDTLVYAPSGGANPALAATSGLGAFSGGAASGIDFAWNEVGILRLRPRIADGSYLGAGDVVGGDSERIGRFVPSHFTAALNAPELEAACTSGAFTYEGQPFGYVAGLEPVITVSARAAGGGAVVNYRGDWFRLATGTSPNRSYASTGGTLDVSGLPSPLADPVVAETMPGRGTLTFTSGPDGLVFERTTPAAPYAADITLSIDVLDADGVAAVGAGPLGNPVSFGAAGGIAFDGGDEIRYGRVRLSNAYGSELVDLPVPAAVEYYLSPAAGFVPNLDDSCTTGVTVALGNFTENLAAGETCVLDSGAPGASGAGCPVPAAPASQFADPVDAGDFRLTLAAPGANDTGSVTVTASVPDWLLYDWDAGTAGDENPSATAVFGLYQGLSQQIYLREVY